MRKILACAGICLLLITCGEKDPKGKFTVKGELRNIKDQEVYLDQLFFSQQNPEVQDTSKVTNGKFKVSAIGTEEGLYRLRFQQGGQGFIFINDNPEISLTGDYGDSSLKAATFHSPANRILKRMLMNIDTMRRQMQEQYVKVENLKTTKNNDSMVRVESDNLAALNNEYIKYLVRFIDTTSHPVVAMFTLGMTRDVDPNELSQAVPNLARRFPDHAGVAGIVIQYNQMMAQRSMQQQPGQAGLPIGTTAPDFTLNDVNGKPVSLKDYRGKYLLVDFWASWCGPCRRENPNIVVAYEKFRNMNFEILGVSLDDDKASWLKAIKDDGLTWKQVSDLKQWNSIVVGLYKFDGIPYNVLLDPKGNIIGTALRDADLHKKLEEVLK